jgi:hypothetical protein
MIGYLPPFWVKKCGGNAKADHGGEYCNRMHESPIGGDYNNLY